MAEEQPISTLPVKQVRGWVTNIDRKDLKEEYAIEATNVRFDRPGIAGERDPGTIHRFTNYPQNPSKNVTAGTNTTPIVLTVPNHNLLTGDKVDVLDVAGLTASNGKRRAITKLTDNTFSIDGSIGNAVYTGGGIVRLSMTIVDSQPLFITSEAKEYEILVTVDGRGNMRLWVRPVDESTPWEELTTIYTGKVNGTPAVTTLVVTIDGVKTLIGDTAAITTNLFQYYIAYNKNRNNAIFVVSNTNGGVLTSECYIGSDLLGWVDNDDLVLYKMQGVYDIDLGTLDTFFRQGQSPHIRWLKTTELNKVNLYFGGSADPPVMQYTIRIQNGVNTITPSLRDATYYKFNTRTSWYIDVAETTPVIYTFGTKDVPIGYSAGMTAEIGEGLRAFIKTTDPARGSVKYHYRGYITLLYRGITNGSFYEESDPVTKFYVSPPNAREVIIEFVLELDLSRLSKSVCGMRFYVATKKDEDIASSLANWFDDPTEYSAMPELDIITGLGLLRSEHLFDNPGYHNLRKAAPTTRFMYQYYVSKPENRSFAGTSELSGESILGNLNHSPQLVRKRMKPRFAVRVEQGIGGNQGAAILVDDGDRQLRRSSYSGAGAHMDDNFANVSIDNDDTPQRILLTGSDQLIGISVTGGIVGAIRHTAVEFFDLQSRNQWTVFADAAAGRGIVHFPGGVLFLGDSEVYVIDANGGPIGPVGIDIKNLIDGSLKLQSDPMQSLVTAEARSNAIAGYEPTFHTIWMQIETYQEDGTTKFVNYRFATGRKNFSPRVLNIGTVGPGKEPVKAFSYRLDGTMTIVYADGLLAYPNLDGENRFEDDVLKDGTSQGRGGEFNLRVVLGSISSLTRKFNLQHIISDVVGRSENGMGRYGVRIYGNRRPTAFDEKNVLIDEKPIKRGIDQQIGDLESAEVEWFLPEESLDNFKEVVVSGADVGFLQKQRNGNR